MREGKQPLSWPRTMRAGRQPLSWPFLWLLFSQGSSEESSREGLVWSFCFTIISDYGQMKSPPRSQHSHSRMPCSNLTTCLWKTGCGFHGIGSMSNALYNVPSVGVSDKHGGKEARVRGWEMSPWLLRFSGYNGTSNLQWHGQFISQAIIPTFFWIPSARGFRK